MWRLKTKTREWQSRALELWSSDRRGVVSVVTGGGKTIFAFLCMNSFREAFPEAARFIVVVPTLTLLDQWHIALQEDFGVIQEDIACFSGQERTSAPRRINIVVINSARALTNELSAGHPSMLIVDECHRAGSQENSKALDGNFEATLGLSATPKREYDEGFEQYVVPKLGNIIFEYNYNDAFNDQVITPFDLINLEVELLPHEREEYDRLTRRAAILFQKSKVDPEAANRLKRLLQKRAGVSALARMRLPVSAKIVEEHRGTRTIVFLERVSSANTLYSILKKRNHSVCLYHSKIAPTWRRDNLRLFRQGVFDVLISCRALDEGMNVPETAVAIIASSTASSRQRIQRLGRVLRPSRGKDFATIYTLFATESEKRRLSNEEAHLEGVACVTWGSAVRE